MPSPPFPLSGQCPEVADWAAFVAHFQFLEACGIVSSIKDLYWDIRPKPEFGTVEIRVAIRRCRSKRRRHWRRSRNA